MTNPFFDPLRASVHAGDDQIPSTIFVDPTLARVQDRERWEARAAQWRARELAEAVFGGEVRARMVGPTPTDGRFVFRGLLHLDVPFSGMAEHREHEARFVAAATVDPVLARVPLVFVFGAVTR